MRRPATIPLAVCFVLALLLLSIGGSLLAQEEVRPATPLELPTVSTEKGEDEVEELRGQEQTLRKQIEELTRRLDEIRKKGPERLEAAAEAPRRVHLRVQPAGGRRRTLRTTPATYLAPEAPGESLNVEPFVAPATEPAIADVALAEAPPAMNFMEIGPVYEFVVVPSTPPGRRGIELRKQELERVMRSHGDRGLVTLLRFEKVKVCRKAEMYDQAVQELQKIIEENLADETTNAARWTLVEILQEQKKNEEAMAELEKIFISASDTQDRMDAIYGIINLSGEGPKARIQAIERLIQALLRDQANWDQCTSNLKRLYAAERKYAQDHDGYLSEKLSDLYPDYADNLDVFTCPAAKGPKITRKEDIDSLTSYILVAKGEPADIPDVESEGRPRGHSLHYQDKIWIREKEQNHGRRYLTVSGNGGVGWVGAPYVPPPFPFEPVVPMGPYHPPVPLMEPPGA